MDRVAHPWRHVELVVAPAEAEAAVPHPPGVGEEDRVAEWEAPPRRLGSQERLQLSPADRDFREPRPIGQTTLDDNYTDVVREDGETECLYRDPAAGAEVSVRADRAFREIIAYAPPHLPAICLEPYTCVPDALNLQPKGLDAGLVVLEPGASWHGRIWIGLRQGEGHE